MEPRAYTATWDEYVAGSGIDVLITIRGAARFMAEQAKQAGMSDGAAYFFDDPAEAGKFLRTIACEGRCDPV